MEKLLKRALIGLAFTAVFSTAALAVDTCNGFVHINYVSHVGDVVRMQVSLGTGSIQGGTKLTIESLQLFLDCNANFPLTPPCMDEGAVIEYEGDGTITTTCADPGPIPIAWSSNVSGGGSAINQITCRAPPAPDIRAGSTTPPGAGDLEFDVKVIGPDTDGDGKIEQLVGYDIAKCDNGVLVSGGFQTSDLPPTTTTTTTTTTTSTTQTTSTTTKSHTTTTNTTPINTKTTHTPY